VGGGPRDRNCVARGFVPIYTVSRVPRRDQSVWAAGRPGSPATPRARRGGQGWLRLPLFDDFERERAARTLRLLAVSVIVAYGVGLAFAAWGSRPDWGPEGLLGPAAAALAALLLARRGWLQAAAGVLLLALAGGVAYAVLRWGTLSAPPTAGFLLVILAAGLVMGVRGALASAVACTLATLGFEWLFAAEVESDAPRPTPETLWWVGLLWMTFLAVCIPVWQMRSALDRLHRTREDLEARNRALRESDQRYRTLLADAPLGVLVLDRELMVRDANAELARLIGAPSPASLIGDALAESDFWSLPHVREAVTAVLEDGRRVHFEATAVTRFGRKIAIRAHVAPLLDAGGQVVGGQAILEDMAPHRALESRLLESERLELVGQLAGAVAHDFNNFVSAILFNAELLSLRLPADHGLQRHVEQIVRAARGSASLTRQLLAFGRRQELRPEALEPSRVVETLEPMLQSVLGESVELELEIDPEDCCVHVDPAQLEVALLNLVYNARDAMPSGGRLTIRTRTRELDLEEAFRHSLRPGSYVEIEVCDTGCGMDADTRRHAFDPLFTTKGAGGTGLGLPSVLGFVTQSGGSIELEGAPGQGTSVRLFLPRVQAPPREAADTPPAEAPRGHETILLVEDLDMLRTVVRAALERSGYRVLEARDGREALEYLEAQPGSIDLLLTDVVMPGMGGAELVRRLQQLSPRPRVLFMTGYAEQGAGASELLEPEVELLHKPFAMGDLLSGVREALDPGGADGTRS